MANDIVLIDKETVVKEIQRVVNPRFVTHDFNGVLYQSRFYVFLHEMFHSVFKEKPERFREVITTLQVYARMTIEKNIKLFINELDESGERNWFNALNCILEETDMVFVEELACDFHAFIHLLH